MDYVLWVVSTTLTDPNDAVTFRITSICRHKYHKICISIIKYCLADSQGYNKKSCHRSLKTLEPPYTISSHLMSQRNPWCPHERRDSPSRRPCNLLSSKAILKLLGHLLKFLVQSLHLLIHLYHSFLIQDHQEESEHLVHDSPCPCYFTVPCCAFIAMYYTSKTVISSIRRQYVTYSKHSKLKVESLLYTVV